MLASVAGASATAATPVGASATLATAASLSPTAPPSIAISLWERGRIRLRTKANTKPARVLVITTRTGLAPVLPCTAVSVIILWEQRDITPRMVMALAVKSIEPAMASIAYIFTK